MNTIQKFILTAGVVMTTGSLALAQDGSGALQRKLDNPIKLTQRNTPLSAVFQALARQSGVLFDVAPDTYQFLPYGEDTRLDVTLPGQSLRDTLTKMLAPQGLTWDVSGSAVRILPAEPLYRLARRATYDELGRLGALMTMQVQDSDAKDLPKTLAFTTGIKDWKVILPPDWTDQQVQKLQAQFAQAQPSLACDWLDAGCGRDLTWRLDGDRIVILTRKDQILHQLERRVSLQYKDADLMTVLLDLAKQARVSLNPSAGVMNYLPPAVRNNFTLAMSDASISQAFKVISGSTGLEFPISEEGIGVERATEIPIGPADTRGTVPGAAPGVFVQTVIPTSGGRELRVFFVPSEMSPELQAALEKERRRINQELEKHFVNPNAETNETEETPDTEPPAFKNP